MLRFILGTLASIGVVLIGIVIEGGNLLSYFALTAFAIALLVPFFAVGLTCPLYAALLGLVYRILGARVGRGRG